MSSRKLPRASTAPTTRNGRPVRRTSKPRPPTVPTCQNRKVSMVARSVSSTPDVQLESAAVSAAPAIASLTGVAPSRPSDAIACTATMASAAPANANQTYAERSETPKNEIASTIANEAPALMPRMPGSASGLRVRPCRQAPARPERGADDQRQAGARQPGDGDRVVRVGRVEQRGRRDRRRARPAPTAPTRPAPRRAESPPRCWSASVRRWRAVRTPSRGRSEECSGAVDRLGDLREEVLDGVGDRQRGRVGHGEADVLVLLARRRCPPRGRGSGRAAGRR